ncbi:alginate export family protein [Cytophagaceae bacterium YF14B1]|uniref:Alginate export family protein n=1 Tax=Xanthocytophaga flava TaxID=3048013 RepID=A0AAE3U5M8_9BACT|nr:alginate export family protein [Xanthocytophaga flavus]MDJ1480959.1 alginate export family protein [Xanthocytophaga flavus]
MIHITTLLLKGILLFGLATLPIIPCFSQITPSFKSLRYEEEYAYLKMDSSRNWYKKTKYLSLSPTGNTYLSFGGDIRYQYFWFKNEDWGDTPQDKDGYILTRYLAHADFRAGKNFRAFVQLQSSLANGKEAEPSPVENSPLNLHQAFIDITLPLNNTDHLTTRIGRQELLYGSQRLVSVREGPNNRQSFDAARLLYEGTDWKADFFYSHSVRAQQQIFADGFTKHTRFWGAYTVVNHIPFLQNADIYYFGLHKQQAAFDDGEGRELRHSIGTRLWNSTNNFRYDLEGVYQFGSFGTKDIHAWTLSANTGYKFSQTKLQPEIGLKAELISGNASYTDNTLQTFNPLFPRGAYFGLAALIGPANLIDIHPSLDLDLTPKLIFGVDYDVFWRYSQHDGIYAPNVSLIYSGKDISDKFIGQQFITDLVYTPNNFLYFRGELTWFAAGDFLKAAGTGKDILFSAATIQLKF